MRVRVMPYLSFQSTLSVRRATDFLQMTNVLGDISIHALREESDQYHYGQTVNLAISIHALREESDHEFIYLRRTDVISIHALREESD